MAEQWGGPSRTGFEEGAPVRYLVRGLGGAVAAVLLLVGPVPFVVQHAAGNPNAGCNQTPYTTTLGSSANKSGPYNDTFNGLPSGNGSGGGLATGQPCSGCVGKPAEKHPGSLPGRVQFPTLE